MLAAIVLTPLREFGVARGNERVAAHMVLGGGLGAQGLLDLTHLFVCNLVRLRLLVRGIHLRGLGPPDGGTTLRLQVALLGKNPKAITITDGTHVGSSRYNFLPSAQRKAKVERREKVIETTEPG